MKTVRKTKLARLPSPLIMVADADGHAAQQLAGYLVDHVFQAAATSSGREVLALAGTGRLVLVIVDMELSDMSGLALTSWLEEVDATIPVLMTSADYRPEAEIDARKAGIIYYAHKPTDYRLIAAVVAKALAGPPFDRRAPGVPTAG